MTAPQLRLMLVDDDPVFRLGLRIWLEQSAGHRVVAEAGQADDALAVLQARTTLADSGAWSEIDDGTAAAVPPIPDLDLVILDLGLGTGDPSQMPGLQLCHDIKTQYPGLPVLVLSAQAAPVLKAAAHQMGADGFAPRSLSVKELDQLLQALSRSSPAPMPLGEPEAEVSDSGGVGAAMAAPTPGLGARLRLRLRRSSLRQIEAALTAIDVERRRGRSDLLAEAILAGRYRELKAARWLMNRILATPGLPGQGEVWPRPGGRARAVPSPPSSPGLTLAGPSRGLTMTPANPLGLTQADRLALQQGDLSTIVFERVFRKLQGNLDNTSDIPLETDILRDDKKRELFFLTLRQIEDALDSLRRAGVPPGQLPEKTSLILQDVWSEVIDDFFGRYYTLPMDNLEQPVVPALMAELEVVQAAILDHIPGVPMLLSHLLFRESLVVDGSSFIASTPEAMDRSQGLLENLLIQLANAVMQPLLNQFGDVELLKKNLYQRRMMTSRDIARFRNDLSWRYRWDQWVNEPRAIFESQYRLFGFTERGLQTQFIYAPRRQELDQLSGLQRTVTLAVEARDAISPRFRSLVALVGSGVVYVLTDVIGRGIGLVGRGILRGVGSAWNDTRYRGKE
jgi:DNA-binding NarL/FixJ family response regulator